MARTSSKPKSARRGGVDRPKPTLPFESFKWTPDGLSFGPKVQARELADLVERVKDVTLGAVCVFELISAQEIEIDRGSTPYLSPYQISCLSRMAMRSLIELDDRADEAADRLHKLTRLKAPART